MSDPAPTSVDKDTKTPEPKPSAIGGLMRILVPAILAAGASYGGARAVASHPPAPQKEVAAEAHPPGPTIALEPFLLTVADGGKKNHAMRITVAIEFEHSQKEETLKLFQPRIRDAILSHLRTVTYEEATSNAPLDKLRGELLEKCKGVGAAGAERILVTEMVVQ